MAPATITALECLVVADDLTGAFDAVAPFAARGWETTVLLPGGAHAGNSRVLAVSTESREATPEEVRDVMRNAAHRYLVDAGAVVFKKIDSTLRCNTGLEIAAAMEAFGCRAAIVCPAFPAMDRVVHQGYLKVAGAPDFAPIPLVRRVSCVHVPHSEVRSAILHGERYISVDAVCNEDLDRIAAEILPLDGPILWAGSAGLAAALARLKGGSVADISRPRPCGPVLFCIGSDHAVTLAQENALMARGRTVRMQLDGEGESIAGALARSEHVLLRIPRNGVAPEAIRKRLAGAAPAALMLSGGDTASALCRAIGAQSIRLCDELVPGIPLGILRGGPFDGGLVVTKPGGFGKSDALIHIADYFSCPNL